MDIGYDEYGYYDLETGEEVVITYGWNGQPINALTGEEVGGIVNAARDTLIGIFGRQGYPPYAYPRGQQYPQGQYPQQRGSGGGYSGGGAGINLSTNTLMLIVGGVVLFMLGRRR